MRVTFQSAGRELIFNLRQAQARRAAASQEISSGLRVTRPSDSPADAAAVVRTSSELARIAQFRDNLGAVQGELRTADGALSQASIVLTRALALTTQAADSTKSPEARDAIRVELEGIFRHLALIANTSHGGRALFAGSAADTVPFEIDANSSDGVVYRGDAASRAITFPDARPAQISLPGNEIFLRPDLFTGSGRTSGTTGAASPSPPVGIGIAFSGDVDAVISADLPSFFVATAPPGLAVGGETITVNFTSADGAIITSIITPPLAGGETTAQIATLLNTEIAANAALAGGFVFSDEGGNLKLVQHDALGVSFSFTSSATGGLTSGLEPGGVTGGQSAEEIAAALNTQVLGNSQLNAAAISFTAVNGEVQVDGNVDFSFTAIDFDRGSGFQSGLAGTHLVGGSRSANIFAVLNQLIQDLASGNLARLEQGVDGLQRAVNKIGGVQGFYGSTLRQIEITQQNLVEADVVNQQILSERRDADVLDSIGVFTSSSSAEQFALQVAARSQPNLLDLLA